MTRDEEIRHLESVLAGSERSGLRPPAVRGRLVELYLTAPAVEGKAESALALAEEGLSMVSAGDPLYAKLLHSTARALRSAEPAPSGALGPDGRAARLDREAVRLTIDTAPKNALLYSEQWGDWAWDREVWAEAGEAYADAVRIVARILRREIPGYLDRLTLLTGHRRAGPRSAFAYTRLERRKEAATVLERTAFILTGAHAQRREIDELVAMGHKDLRDRLLAAIQHSVAAARTPGDDYGQASLLQQEAERRVEGLVNEIRALPCRSQFATPSGWADVLQAAEEQPIAYLAPTDKGTLLLVVEKGGRVSAGCLDVTGEEIGLAMKDFYEREFGRQRSDSRNALMQMLDWLGGRILLHVHEAVGDRRFTLVPFGVLATLPLHAACLIFPGKAGALPRFHFLFHPKDVAYTDSARARVTSLEHAKRPRAPGSLVVNNPSPLPATFDELLLSDFERDVVARHFPIAELAGPDATGMRILEELPRADVAHLSCHGTVDKRLHYTGILLVADRRQLSAVNWEGASTLRARLVFLSACRSGATALGVPQVTGIPSSLVEAGAAAVIATFWHTDQMATLLLVTKFYDLWRGGQGIALHEALGRAQEWLSTSSASELRAVVPEAALDRDAGRRLRAALADEHPFEHPWYWAPFFLVGA